MLEQAITTSINSVISYSNSWGSVGDFDDDGVGAEPTTRSIENYVGWVLDAYDAADDEARMAIIVKEHRLASFSNVSKCTMQ